MLDFAYSWQYWDLWMPLKHPLTNSAQGAKSLCSPKNASNSSHALWYSSPILASSLKNLSMREQTERPKRWISENWKCLRQRLTAFAFKWITETVIRVFGDLIAGHIWVNLTLHNIVHMFYKHYCCQAHTYLNGAFDTDLCINDVGGTGKNTMVLTLTQQLLVI